jgi:hypothetical protein
VSVDALAAMYGTRIADASGSTLEEVIRRHAPDATQGTSVTVGSVRLRVVELRDGRIVTVGVASATRSEGDAVP